MESSSSPIRRAAASWWLYMLGGLALVALGFWTLSNPGSAFLGLTVYFAATIVFAGLGNVSFAVSHRERLRGWGWLLALGLGEVVFGIYLLGRPVEAASTLALFIGFWLLLRSGSTVANAFVLRRLGYRRWGWNLGLGLLGAALAFVVLFNPAVGALGATVWLSAALLLLGVALAIAGLRLRRVAP